MVFADDFTLERHGAVTHLLFAAEQAVEDKTQSVVTARVIVPNEWLDTIGRMLAMPAPERARRSGATH
jgi:adenylate cyclase